MEYTQTAKNDLSAQTPADDPRMRYARYRSDRTVRVLGDPKESKSKNMSILNPKSSGSRTRDTSDPDGSAYWDSEPVSRARGMSTRDYQQGQQPFGKARMSLPKRLLIIFLTLVLLAGVGFGIFWLPVFTIKDIEVQGTKLLTREQVKEFAALSDSSTLLRVDLRALKDRLESNVWIGSVELHRSFPSTLIIVVTEEKIAAVVEVSAPSENTAAKNWLISKNGTWLGSYDPTSILDNMGPVTGGDKTAEGATAEGTAGEGTTTEGAGSTDSQAQGETPGDTAQDPSGSNPADDEEMVVEQSLFKDITFRLSDARKLPHIKDISKSVEPQVGATTENEGILNALAIINGFSPQMLAYVKTISAPDKVKTVLSLTNNVGVAFGVAEDIEVKEQVILTLLAEHEGKITYINVRVADRVSYRATG